MTRIELEPVDRVRVTVLMDNLTDPLMVDQEHDHAAELAEGAHRRSSTSSTRESVRRAASPTR